MHLPLLEIYKVSTETVLGSRIKLMNNETNSNMNASDNNYR